jgi:hypothetical protein
VKQAADPARSVDVLFEAAVRAAGDDPVRPAAAGAAIAATLISQLEPAFRRIGVGAGQELVRQSIRFR